MTDIPTRMITDRVDILQKVRAFMHKYDFTGHRQQLVISLLSVCSDYFSAGEMRHCVRMGSPKSIDDQLLVVEDLKVTLKTLLDEVTSLHFSEDDPHVSEESFPLWGGAISKEVVNHATELLKNLPPQNKPEDSKSAMPKPSLRATLSLEVDYDNISEQEIVDGLGCMIDTAMNNGLLTGSTDGEIRDWESFIKVVEIKDGVPVPKDV